MARVLKRSQFYLHTANGMNQLPAFAFPAEAGTHLPTPVGWKAELALDGWLVTYKFSTYGIEPVRIVRFNEFPWLFGRDDN